MGKGLIISNQVLLSSIYTLNLKFYTNSHTLVRKNIAEGIRHLKEPGVKLDYVILIQTEENKKSYTELYQYLKENKPNCPLIVTGPAENTLANIVFIASAYDIKTIIKTTAKILKITAKKMVEVQVPEYISFSGELLKHITKTPVPLFLKQNEIYTQRFAAQELIDQTENFEEIFVLATSRLRFLNHLSASLLTKMIQEDNPPVAKLAIAEKGMEVISENLLNPTTNSPEEIKALSHVYISQLDKTIKEIPAIEQLIKMLLHNNSGYAFTHSVLTAYISKKVIENISWGSKEQIEKVSFVLFYHDIYLTSLYNEHPECFGEKDLLFASGISNSEKDLILKHASLAGELLRQMKQIPMGSDAIVTQHHGTTNGVGFPVECKDDISPLAKVILISEDYVNFFLKQMNSIEGMQGATPQQFFSEVRRLYPKTTYKKIIDTLQGLAL